MLRAHVSRRWTLLSTVIAASFVTPVLADAITWNGATDSAWNTASNWTGTNIPPISGDSLVFGASGVGTTLNNDLTATSFNVAGITYNSGGAALTIDGNAFTLTGSITNNGTAAQIINTPMTLGAVRTITTNTGNITLAGSITGTGGIDKTGGGTLTLGGSNSFTANSVLRIGTSNTNQGAVRVTNSNALGTNAFTINNTFVNNSGIGVFELANNITLPSTVVMNVSGRNASTSNAFLRNVSGNNTFSGNITISTGGGGYGVNLSAGTLTLAGTLTNTVAASTRPFEFYGAGNVVISGATNNTGTGAFGMIFTNSGISTLQQTSGTFSGGVNLNNVAGTLNINSPAALGTGTFTILGGTLNSTATFANQTITTNPPVTVNGNFAFTGTNDLNLGTGAISLGTTAGTSRTITVNDKTLTLGGAISNGTTAVGLIKAGPGALSLGGANAYTGGSTVNAGALTFLNTTAQPATGTTTVAAGATLGLGVGGAGFYSAADLDSLIANTMTNVTLNASSQVGIDTTAGDFTYGPLTQARSIVKLGANKLTLPGNNNFTGNITGFAGVLEMPGNNTFTGNLIGQGGSILMTGDNSFTGNVLASGGTITFSGVNSYSGSTTAAGGTIALAGGNNRLPTGTAFVLGNNGTLDVGNTSQTLTNFSLPAATTMTGTITGNGGTLTLSQATLNLGPTTTANPTVVNISGLSNLVYNNSAGTFRVGPNTTSTGITTQVATVTLANNNTITANLLAVADLGLSSNTGASTLNLGQSNTLNVNTINVGYNGRANATLQFATGLTAPTVTIRGATGGTSSAANFNIGNVANNQTTSWTANADFSAGTLDANVTSMIVGSADSGGTADRRGTQTSNFLMGKGQLNVDTLTIGRIAGTATVLNTESFNATGNFTLNDPTGVVNATTINLATNTITTTNGTARTVNGNLNLVNGTIRATTIQKGAQTGTATAVNTAFNWSAGTIENTASSNLAINDLPITLLTAAAHNFNVTGTNTTTVAATSPISGTGFGITKLGTGTLDLLAANTYTGTTTISAGKLVVNGSTTSNTDVQLAGTLGGSGTITGNVTGSGTVSPGNSIGTLNVVGTYNVAGTHLMEISTPSLTSDRVNVTGSVIYDGILQVQLTGTPTLGDTWNLFDFTVPWDTVSMFDNNAVFGTAGDGTNLPTLGGNLAWGFDYSSGQLSVIQAIPEPSTLVLGTLFGLGLATYSLRRRRSRT